MTTEDVGRSSGMWRRAINLVVLNGSKEHSAFIVKEQAVPEPQTRRSVTSRNTWIVHYADVRSSNHALIENDFLE